MLFRWLLLYSLPVLVVAFVFSARRTTQNVKPLNNLALVESMDDLSPSTETIHLVVLVHGLMGNALEMDYLAQTLKRQVPYDSSETSVVIHSAVSNEGHTNDGIAAGGKRLANEINTLVKHFWKKHGDAQVTLSLVGNSLGGLYARYALSEVSWKDDQVLAQHSLIPRLFVTTCTPHLGVSQHTYIRLPRMVEAPIARVMQTTGRDLFRFSQVIEEMTIQSKYIDPLLAFDQRVAYINIYGTDFQVPTATAAFWADTDSVHEQDVTVATNEPSASMPSSILMQLTTPQRPSTLTQERNAKESSSGTTTSNHLSQQLDHLGWTKVLVDVREHLPMMSWTERNKEERPLQAASFTARELLERYARRGRFQTFPLGHTVLVANAKDALNRYLTKGGQPIMDHLASSMMAKLLTETKVSKN